MSEGEYYNIEKIIGRKRQNGKLLYKIKWEGYPISQCTWEPMKNLESAKELVEEYDRSNPENNQKTTNHKKKDNSFLNKKRNEEKEKEENEEKEKEEKEEKVEEKNQNEKIEDEVKLYDDSNQNIKLNENINEKSYTIDDSLKSVVTVKQQNQKLMAVVDKMEKNGEMRKQYIPTDELRKTNPWILLDFYESKIKFT